MTPDEGRNEERILSNGNKLYLFDGSASDGASPLMTALHVF